MNRTLGMILIVGGLVLLAYGGWTFTTEEKVVDMGPVEINREKTHRVPYTPLLGLGAVIAGGLILVAARKS
jgi:hypothetical protein